MGNVLEKGRDFIGVVVEQSPESSTPRFFFYLLHIGSGERKPMVRIQTRPVATHLFEPI